MPDAEALVDGACAAGWGSSAGSSHRRAPSAAGPDARPCYASAVGSGAAAPLCSHSRQLLMQSQIASTRVRGTPEWTGRSRRRREMASVALASPIVVKLRPAVLRDNGG